MTTGLYAGGAGTHPLGDGVGPFVVAIVGIVIGMLIRIVIGIVGGSLLV